MPDWRAMVEAHLHGLHAAPQRKQEIARELAEHLEEEFQFRRRTLPEGKALRASLRLLDTPGLLRREMELVESEASMNQRTRALWVPGLVSLTLSGLLLVAIAQFGPRPTFVFLQSQLPLILYPIWLLSLPVFGALGAWLAKRAGATRNERLLAGVFPIMTMVAAFFLILPIAMMVEGKSFTAGMIWKGMGLALINWVMLPGVPLLLGAWPFLRNGSTAKLEEAR